MSGDSAHAVVEVVNQLADSLEWPRSRPARVVVGDRALRATGIALVANGDAISATNADVVVLATAPGTALARLGRRTNDPLLESGELADWMREERVVVDASEMLAGGRAGFDELLSGIVGQGVSRPLVALPRDECKFVGFVPATEFAAVRSAVFAAGAGMIGEYTDCSFALTGTGTFRGTAESKPTVGATGVFEEVEEIRFEAVVPLDRVGAVCTAFVSAHSYEEPAYDVYPLATPGRVGLGRRVEGAGTAQLVAGALSEGGIDGHVVNTEARSGAWVVTSGGIGTLLPAILQAPDIAGVVAGRLTPAEQQLLVERRFGIVRVDQAAVVSTLGSRVANSVSNSGAVGAVTFVEPLAFPGAAQ